MNARTILLTTIVLAGCAFGQQTNAQPLGWWNNYPPAPIIDGSGTMRLNVATPTVPAPVYGPATPTLNERKEPEKVNPPSISPAAYGPTTPPADQKAVMHQP